MSRLGDLIRTERLRAKMTPKQVAKKCGVAESYLIAVENGSHTNVSPSADYLIRKEDILVVLGENYALEAVQKL